MININVSLNDRCVYEKTNEYKMITEIKKKQLRKKITNVNKSYKLIE